jgi:hypothetical protein
MGSKVSSLVAAPGPKATKPLVPVDDSDEDDIRPAKRRKTSNASSSFPYERGSPRRKPFGHVTNESKRTSSRLLGKLQAVPPSNYYRKSYPAVLGQPANPAPNAVLARPRGGKTATQNFLPETPVDFKRALRIDILGIVANSACADQTLEFTGGRDSPIETKCRCSVALFGANNDDDSSRPGNYIEVYRTYKTCVLRTTFNHGQVSRELALNPFVLSSDEFYATRKRTNALGDDHYDFDLRDKYFIQVTLEPVGTQKQWPPFDISVLGDEDPSEPTPVTDLLQAGKVSRNQLDLSCQMPGLLEPDRQVRSVSLRLSRGSVKQKISYDLQIKTQWSLPNKYSDVPAKAPTKALPIESSVKLGASPGEAVPATPPRLKVEQRSIPDMGERTPRRRSNVPTYNLKTLSAQAQGYSPRTRRNLQSKSLPENADASSGVVVSYGFGRAGAAELGIKQQTSVAGFKCPFCYFDEGSISNLRMHLHTNHANFKFSLRRSNPSRAGFFVELAKQGPNSSPLERAKTLQLGKARSLFDLDKFLTGDQSWVKAREGPKHNHWPEHLHGGVHESSSSSSPHESRHSSPNTPIDTDDVVDLEDCQPKKVHPRKIFYVPKTNKPLYDTVTKRVLEPGEEIPDSDDEKDETWLHQKHRDVIMDFTDLTDEEKDYITRWNPFIVDAHLTCETYLSDVCLRFAKSNAKWFAERKSRKIEFGKQMETFIMRGVVDQECLDKCADICRATEKRMVNAEKGGAAAGNPSERPVSPSKMRGVLDCVCCEHTQPPDRIVCRGRVSTLGLPSRFC